MSFGKVAAGQPGRGPTSIWTGNGQIDVDIYVDMHDRDLGGCQQWGILRLSRLGRTVHDAPCVRYIWEYNCLLAPLFVLPLALLGALERFPIGSSHPTDKKSFLFQSVEAWPYRDRHTPFSGPAPVQGSPSITALYRVAEQSVPTPNLRDVLMDTFHRMNAAKQGIFHDDISYIVAPYFPPGQTFRDAKAMIETQKLGSLRMFKGQRTTPDEAMYVTQFSLMDAMFSDVSIVLHLDFEGRNEADMVVKKSSAFIRASNM